MPSMMPMLRSWRPLIWLLLLAPVVVIAAMVTAAQVADAVRNSPGANQWLRDNADAVGNLAIRVESGGGNTTAYNGSCCFGILQLTRENIRRYTDMTPEQYRNADLQTQVNAWSQLTADGLRGNAPRTLAGMTTFDGRPVDVPLILSCVQLGIGNCQTMLNSGRCNGFADRLGTTICSMADRMSGGTGGPRPVTGTGGPRPVTGSGGGSIGAPSGSPGLSLEAGFEQGSGVSMARLRSTIQGIVVALTLLIVGAALIGLFKQFGNGVIAKPDLILGAQKAGLIVVMIFIAISLV